MSAVQDISSWAPRGLTACLRTKPRGLGVTMLEAEAEPFQPCSAASSWLTCEVITEREGRLSDARQATAL